jgi:uncharacterized protein YegP (UPF0339 family)
MAGKFEIKESTGGKFRFNLKAGNGQIILSSESYETKQGAEKGLDCYHAASALSLHIGLARQQKAA